MMKGKIWKLLIISSILLIIIVVSIIYINDYYRAEKKALECINNPSDGITVTRDKDIIYFQPEDDIKAGIIFYPGGKVEAESYAPLMEAIAQKDIMAILIEMPANLAVLDINAAEGILEKYPDIDKWYMAGHSLGGSMAASYLGSTEDSFDGLILLASYSTEDLSDCDIEVLSIYGDRDSVLNMNKYNSNTCNLPSDYKEIVVEGGCHAYFGCYGLQDGDGKATITNEEQIKITSEEIESFVDN